MNAPGPFYHGGVRRLHRGGVLLPPCRTGAPSSSEYGAAHVHRRDRVYLTPVLEHARFFALLAPPRGCGDVYEVEPLGELEPDPDYQGPPEGASVAVPMARVVRVVERRVSDVQGLGPREVAALLTPDGDLYVAAARYAEQLPEVARG
jgi:hypothetical protein